MTIFYNGQNENNVPNHLSKLQRLISTHKMLYFVRQDYKIIFSTLDYFQYKINFDVYCSYCKKYAADTRGIPKQSEKWCTEKLRMSFINRKKYII